MSALERQVREGGSRGRWEGDQGAGGEGLKIKMEGAVLGLEGEVR